MGVIKGDTRSLDYRLYSVRKGDMGMYRATYRFRV